ncbi:MAG: tetratricopeptide repeat protein [Nodosilinea sp.]
MVLLKPNEFSPQHRLAWRWLGLGLATTGAAILVGHITQWNLPHPLAQSRYPYPFYESLQNGRQKTLEGEISFYQGRIQRNPEDGLDRAALAGLYIQMAKVTNTPNWYLLAEQSAQQSLANLPFNNTGAVLVLARVAEAQHDFAEAIRLAESAGGVEGMGIAITAKLAMGQVEAAAADAETLADRYPSLGSLTLRALTRAAQGDNAGAEQDFQRAIAAEEPASQRSSAQTRVLLGRFYFAQGDLARAEPLYREALTIVPDYPLAHLQLAELKTRAGQYRAARHHYRQVVSPVALHGLARLQALQGRDASQAWQTAETALRQQIDENGLGHRRDLAQVLLERGNPEDVPEAVALMAAEAAQRRDPKTLDLLAWALVEAGRLPEAQRVIHEALDQGVRDAGIAYRAGEIELALNHPEQAEPLFRLAQEIDPSFDEQTRRRLGLIAQNQEVPHD